ncbi:MAG: HAD domain-containing protein [Polaromonas sp.]
MMNLLSLDFDGVLHRASDSVLLNFRENAPAWEMEIALKAQSRFVWAPYLVEAIGDRDVAIIIHSTWRKRYEDATMKHFLPPEVASRVISLDGQIAGRKTLSGDDYLLAALDLIAPSSLCVLDDRPDFFEGGKVQMWLSQNHGRFVWCEPDVGLQSAHVREEIIAWSRTDPTRNMSPVPNH